MAPTETFVDNFICIRHRSQTGIAARPMSVKVLTAACEYAIPDCVGTLEHFFSNIRR